MALTVKCLKNGALGTTSPGTLYTISSGKAQILKSIRLVNTTGSGITITDFKVTVSGGSTTRVLPPNMSIPPNSVFVDDSEITLGPSDSVAAYASASGIDY